MPFHPSHSKFYYYAQAGMRSANFCVDLWQASPVLPQPHKNPFTISKIPFPPQNFPPTQTVEKIKKIQAI
jgi:hypothetical protein